MGAAFGWGLLTGSSLVIGSLIAIWFHISLRATGVATPCSRTPHPTPRPSPSRSRRGAILTMPAATMMPEAFERGGSSSASSPRSASVAFGIHALG
jgi:hypothetical protein